MKRYAGAKKVADQIYAVEHGTMEGPERAYLISEVSMRLNRSDLTGALSVAYQSAKNLFPGASEFVLDTAANEIVFKIGKGYTTSPMRGLRKNPRTRKRIGGTVETYPAEFADPGEARIAALRRVLEGKQYAKIDGQMVDTFSASAIVQVYDALNDANKAKYRALTVPKMAGIAWKFVKNPRSRRNPIKGPGKFEGETYAAKYAYESPDEELGSVDELGWYGRFSGKIKGRGPFHIIVHEDSQGFVTGEIFGTEKEMQEIWALVEADYAEFYGNGE